MRLSARYKHFWARGKYYQRFWLNSGDAQANGTTLTVTASIIAGQQQADSSIAGQTLTDTLSLIAGTPGGGAGVSGVTQTITSSITASGTATGGTGHNETGGLFTITASLDDGDATVDATPDGYQFDIPVTLIAGNFGQIDVEAPLNTRLNARYRHFWGRRRTERHFWAQWEGLGIGPTLADGDLIIATAAIIEAGDVHADANIDGVTLTVDLELDQGPTAIVTPGQMTIVSAVVAEGSATADANIAGQTLTINPVLVQGWARFDTITIELSILSGTVFVPPDALAIPEVTNPIVVSLSPGVTITDGSATGADQEVVLELIAGQGSSHIDVAGDTLTVDVTLADATSSADAFIDGVRIDQRVLLFEGVATGSEIEGEALVVTTSIISGVATGEDNSETEQPSQSARVAGPVSYRKAPASHDAQAFGANFTVGYGIVAGKPTVGVLAEAPQPIVTPSPSHMAASDVVVHVLPESITKLLEVVPEPVAVHTEPVAVSPEPAPVVKPKRDWIAYDNELLELI